MRDWKGNRVSTQLKQASLRDLSLSGKLDSWRTISGSTMRYGRRSPDAHDDKIVRPSRRIARQAAPKKGDAKAARRAPTKSTRPSTKNKSISFEYTVVNSSTYDCNSVPLAPRKSTVTFGRICWIISGAQWPLLLICARLTSTGKINRPCALTCDNVAIKYGEKKLTHTRMKRIIHVLPPLLTRASWKQKALSFDNPSVPLQGRSDDSTGPM